MPDKDQENSMRIERNERQRFRIHVSMDLTTGESRWIPRGSLPALVMDPFRPTRIGWRWSSRHGTGDEIRSEAMRPFAPPNPDQRSISFSYSLYKKDTCPSALSDEVDAFFPVGESSYSTDVEIDPGTGTVCFPLPEGRSIHNLEVSFDLRTEGLDWFVERWFYDKDGEAPLPFGVESVSHYDEDGFSQQCCSMTTGTWDFVEIPAELLRDPIRNGSVYLEHGFNPWNPDQKARIVAHLETELVRLADLFRRDSSLTPSGVPASDA